MPADLAVIFCDLDLAGSHIYAHNHLSVDRFGCCELGRDSDLGAYELSRFVRCKFERDLDLSLGGCLCVRVLNVFGHLHECLVELFGKSTAGESLEVDVTLYACFLHFLDPPSWSLNCSARQCEG